MSWWDDFTNFFSGGDDSLTSTQSSVLNDIDINGDGNIGSTPISSYGYEGFAPDLTNVGSDDGYNTILGGYDYGGGKLTKVDSSSNAPWYTNPNLIGSAITAGAGLLQGMSGLDIQKQQLKAQQERDKMNNLLELAKLKNQILMRGAGGSGRGGSGGRGGEAASLDRQYSTNKISQLSNLGANLANIYKG